MGDEGKPDLATVIPVFNEAPYIEACLSALLHQSVDPASHMILVLDGGSTDDTVERVQKLAALHAPPAFPRLLLVSNPERTVAHARNLALEILPDSVEFLVEMIGHAEVDPDHIAQRRTAWTTCEALAGTSLAGVGVQVEPASQQPNRLSQYIDAALASPLAQSGGQFHRIQSIEPTKVPAFVMHRRSALEAVSGWNPAFITSQDSELSMRLLDAGYALYRSPVPVVAMHKRDRWLKWWKMGHRYGFWRTKVLKQHPRRASWKEFLPWLGALSTATMWVTNISMWWVLAALYGFVLCGVGLRSMVRLRSPLALFGVPLCLVMLHTSFSIGLVDGLLRQGRMPTDRA